ncbi:hypothetical protein GGI13_002597 [Coemansia sp. RSA 455]|nr:hypothetical protein GGI13_002597 [Coemansia sp. RSA 455]
MSSSVDVNVSAPKLVSVDERIRSTLYPGAVYASCFNDLNTLSERRIRQMSGAIRAKPDWVYKSQSAEVIETWKVEAQTQSLTDLETDYVLAELGYYASLHSSGTKIFLSAVDGAWLSDCVVDDETAKALREHTAVLENMSAKDRDCHPNSNDRVLNLIDPSLYPLMYQRSSVLSEPIASPLAALDLKSFGRFLTMREDWSKALNPPTKADKVDEGLDENMAEVHLSNEHASDKKQLFYVADTSYNFNSKMFRSSQFCWLPAEFRIDNDSTTTIESYINNLHPRKHAVLYPILGSIFSKLVPILEQVVTDLLHPRSFRVIVDSSKWYESKDSEPDDTWTDDFDERHKQWKEDRVFIQPQPEPFAVPDRPTTPYCLRGRRLQAIVKMSNIELTPDNPEYDGEDWLIDTMANERVIATGIYYYDVENIAECNIAFREKVSEDIDSEQDDWRGVGLAYGINEEDGDEYDGVPLTQNIGSIEIKQGRCIVFPNIYQHQTSRLKLANPTKQGFCKTLVFYFVDPATRIPSTEIVPPQQQSWWAENVLSVSPLSELPLLVKEGILGKVSAPMSLEEAKKVRLELMAERRESNRYVSNSLFTCAFYIEN